MAVYTDVTTDDLTRFLCGYDIGEPDGRLGGQTRSAIRAFQSRTGRVPDGFASASVLDMLRGR